MPLTPSPDRRPARLAGDDWVDCSCGARHWGLFGAAGLLLAGTTDDGAPAVVLQHRARWSHHGGTWGIPGGALAPGESAVAGALREAGEEAGVPEAGARAWVTSAVVHPEWSYTTVVADTARPFTPAATDAESLDVAWVEVDAVEDRPLLPAFAAAWPSLVPLLHRRLALVVDGANVVGSTPDGWWRDRPGAAARLHERLVAELTAGRPAHALGLPGDRWWPDVVLVLEGQARAADVGPDLGHAAAPRPAPSPRLAVARAARDGDAEIVAVVRALLGPGGYTDVVVATADRGLGARVRAAGGAVVGPRALDTSVPLSP